MIQLNERSLFSLFLFIFTSVLLISSLGMKGDVVLVPRIMGMILLIFSAIQFLSDLIPAIRKKIRFAGKDSEDNPTEQKESLAGTYIFIGWMLVFVLFILFTNMIVASVISFFIYLKWIAKESWKLSVLYPIIFGVAIYFIFVVGMGVHYFI